MGCRCCRSLGLFPYITPHRFPPFSFFQANKTPETRPTPTSSGTLQHSAIGHPASGRRAHAFRTYNTHRPSAAVVSAAVMVAVERPAGPSSTHADQWPKRIEPHTHARTSATPPRRFIYIYTYAATIQLRLAGPVQTLNGRVRHTADGALYIYAERCGANAPQWLFPQPIYTMKMCNTAIEPYSPPYRHHAN